MNYTAICKTPGCGNENESILIEGYDGSGVICGVCGIPIEERADWYEPPELEPAPDPVIDVLNKVSALSPEDLARLSAMLGETN